MGSVTFQMHAPSLRNARPERSSACWLSCSVHLEPQKPNTRFDYPLRDLARLPTREWTGTRKIKGLLLVPIGLIKLSKLVLQVRDSVYLSIIL